MVWKGTAKKTNQQEFRIKKVIKKKVDKLYVKLKDYDSSFNSWFDLIWFQWANAISMSQYSPKPYEPFGGDINVKVDLSNHATKTDLKNVSDTDISTFALKSNLASLKTDVNKLYRDKVVTVPVDLSKLSDVVKNDVVEKTVFDKLVAKVNSIDTSRFVVKT